MTITAVKRPIPQTSDEMAFKAGGAILPGQLVKMSAANTIVVSTATDGEVIGVALYDDRQARLGDDAAFASGDVVPVSLFGKVVKTSAAGIIAVGNFVKAAASGQVQVEATAGTKTLNTIGYALTAAGTDAEIDILVNL